MEVAFNLFPDPGNSEPTEGCSTRPLALGRPSPMGGKRTQPGQLLIRAVHHERCVHLCLKNEQCPNVVGRSAPSCQGGRILRQLVV